MQLVEDHHGDAEVLGMRRVVRFRIPLDVSGFPGFPQ